MKPLETIREEFNEKYTSMGYGQKWRPGFEYTPVEIADHFLSIIAKEREETLREGQIKGWESALKDAAVVCGKLQEFPDKVFAGGCGEPVPLLKAYACVDCSAPFHRKCLLKHIHEDMPATSLTKMSLEDGLKKIDELEALATNSKLQ